MVDPVKKMVAEGSLQPRCNDDTRNYRNQSATTLQQSATKPQPTLNCGCNRATASFRSGAMVAPRLVAPMRPCRRFGTKAGVHRGVETFSRSTL